MGLSSRNRKGNSSTSETSRSVASAGPQGISVSPPAYGSQSVDRALAQTAPEAEPPSLAPIQRKEGESAAGGDAASPPPNHTGLPDSLKAGVESLSGLSLEDVRVHSNSTKPAQLGALAYTQGSDIHVAPGQERHIPHEAWHVVQQKQGRVRPTIQMKSGARVNDDERLEREADVMGGTAVQSAEKQFIPKTTGNSAKKQDRGQTRFSPIQRKIAFTGVEALPADDHSKVHEIAEGIHERTLQAMDTNAELLKKTFGTVEFEKVRESLNLQTAFANNVWDLVISPIDHGEINLENPAHVVFFFGAARNFLIDRYEAQRKKEAPEKEKQEAKSKVWQEAKDTSPDPDHSYKTALLGTGASIADYLNVNGHSLEPAQTVILGEDQPWSPTSEKSRGIGFVNHPMHMISPLRDKTHLPEEISGTDETFEGNAAALSEDIASVMARFSNKTKATIIKVSKLDKWYKIETSAGNFYALKVVAGLGIGPHKFEGINKRAKEITSETDKEIEKKRLMDLDAFQRQLKDPESNIMKEHQAKKEAHRLLTIGVAGPNAGVDAVHEATELGMGVDWVVSSGPAIAEGMGNPIHHKGLVDLYFDYLNGWTISRAGYVKMDISGKGTDARNKAAVAFLKTSPGWRASEETTVLVDYLVIAQGPDIGKVWSIFDKSVTDQLTLKGDKQGRFGAPEGGEGTSVRTSLGSGSYNVYWEGIYPRVESVLVGKAGKWQAVRDKLAEQTLAILEEKSFDDIALQKDVAIGLGSEDDDSLEIIGGSVIRILNYLDGLKASHDKKLVEAAKLGIEVEKAAKLRKEAEETLEKIPEKLRSGDAEKKMKKVIETLSSPTILNNDQLTPIRSQVEALGDYMPSYIGSDESNFVTDDQTMIAAQIASYYGNIPATLANWVTQKIIKDRHEKGVKPGTSEGGRAFVNKWKDRLEKLHQLFAKEKILAISEEE